ncbi:hypothetical protein QVD17_20752 [Tagetes erecta]|uniref:C3H1-type domain-containing protein n=1 Tax=Tagetes erecta TaxID=13708 RepID=A0AAD8NRA1_TARER|nr:hypothetical protein QVD17_20752 [Tagetes erecta]
MVGATTHQHQQQQQLTHPSSSSITPEEDEILKTNTDCVYFLASPLTCKKGSECEYRHSDNARVNPRDCWYWLNGNCVNPKCSFRHPPLEGLLGSDVSATMVPHAPAQHTAPYAMPKQGVACIFFQKGFCLKGHLCPFSHGPSNSVNNKPTQPGLANPVTEPPKMAQHVHKSVEFVPFKGKEPSLPTRNGVDKKIAPPARLAPPPVKNEPPSHKPNHGHERIVNGKDADEYSREPSPGFDVLVDNEVEDSRHDYDVDHVDRGMYREHRDYDHYNERSGHFDVENESDLRHRLSKQRRGYENSSRSVVNRETHSDRMPRRDNNNNNNEPHTRPDQGTFSSRLRGRIKIPGRSTSPDTERRHLSRPLGLNQSRVRERTNDTKFAGPKRLSELKSVGTEHHSNDERFLGKRKYPKVEEDLSFEGPKPLSEILKRKRGVNDNNNNNSNNSRVSSLNTEDSNNKKEIAVSVAENEKDKQVDVNYVNDDEGEDGLIDEDALLDEELEAYDENRDGEYEYEQMDGEEDYNLDEGEYVDEVGDEYENKESVVYS